MEEEVKAYSDSREEDEEDEAAGEITIPITRELETTTNRLHHHQDPPPSNFANHHRKPLDFTDLSLGTTSNNNEEDPNFQLGGGGGSSSSTAAAAPVEKEHMFDKVVTPSDVGKLNRLVIPKQHAEKYFPLDSSSTDNKGLLLNFEDRNGKMWRFRYSYWNSSQSYVMTKGWSRFVKEKKLDAGDIVSFQRGLGESFRHRLYIDWRRRPDPSNSASSLVAAGPLFLPNPYSIRWGGRLYSLPSPPSAAAHPPPHHVNYNNNHMYTFQQNQQYHHQQQQQQYHHHHHVGGSSHYSPQELYYLRSTPSVSMVDHHHMPPGQLQQERGSSMIIDSVPVAHHQHQHHHNLQQGAGRNSGAGKRLRLFGVNMECASSSPGEASLPSSSSSPVPPPPPHPRSRFGDQRGEVRETSVLFDLDPTLQYRQQ